MRPSSPAPVHLRTRTGRSRSVVGLVAVALLAIASTACASSDAPGAASTTTEAADAGVGAGSTSTSAAGGDGDPSTTVATDDHGPLPTVELSADEQAYVDALMQEPPGEMDAEQAECIASHWINSVGVDALVALGVTPELLASGSASTSDVPVDRATAEKVVDAYELCELDVASLIVDGFAGMVGDDPAKVACLEGAVTPEAARDYMIEALMATGEGSPDLSSIRQLVEPCLT